jgi:hypothetical protein
MNVAGKLFFFLFSICGVSFYSYGQGTPTPNIYDTLPIKYDSLKAAVVMAPLRSHMRGDTLEYNTEHVRMRPNAIVEDLLRRLPGLRIDPDGSIFYNGEKIQHLLVDGEDIFGDNPTMVTRNFDASKIARVQILDRKSDQAQFTGLDDGSRVKTLNLVMKESAKNGFFGKIDLGESTTGYHNATGAIAGFREQEQLTMRVTSDNTGPLTSGFSSAVSDPLGASAGIGIPRVAEGSIHYSNHWLNFGGHPQVNYQYGQIRTNPVTITQTQQTQPNGLFDQFQQSQSVNQQDEHAVHIVYDQTTGSKSALHVDLRNNLLLNHNQFKELTSSRINDSLANNSDREILDQSDKQNIIGYIFWRIQTGKAGDRIFTLNTGLSKLEYSTNGYLHGVNQYFQTNDYNRQTDTIDQRKRITDHSQDLHGGITYTQPIFARIILAIRYALAVVNDRPQQQTYSRGDGKYDELIDSLTSNLASRTVNQQARLNLQGKYKSFNYVLGLTWTGYYFRQSDKLSGPNIYQRFNNMAPILQVNYTPKPTLNAFFQYTIVVQQPSYTQLASITNNSDPLHLTVGNPNLQPATNHNFVLSFRWLRSWMINTNLNATLTDNSISTRITTDSLGRQVSQSVNVNGSATASLNLSVNHTLGGVDWGFNTINNYSRVVNFVNANLTRNDVVTTGGGVSATRYIVDKYSFQLNTNFTHFLSKSSINSSTLQYWTQSHSVLVALYLIPRYEVGTSGTFTWQGKTSAFAGNTSVLLWNAYISRTFFHDNLTVKALMNNILDQNSGITRSNVGNTNTQTATNILGRYWMLSVSYHFDRKFKKKAN